MPFLLNLIKEIICHNFKGATTISSKLDVDFHLRRARFQVLISMTIFGQDRNKVTYTYVQNIYNVVTMKSLHEGDAVMKMMWKK